MTADRLGAYRDKRNFSRTPEPAGAQAPPGRSFVVQMHAARRLHYDFRLEWDGVLLSWAVTRGPSADPSAKRLAVRTEDHPVAYGGFEGTIPAGEYGGGTVMLWDRGTYAPLGDWEAGLAGGKLKFVLEGVRLRGAWTLVRMKPKAGERRENWLLIKERDGFVEPEAEGLVACFATSVVSGRSLKEIAEGKPARKEPESRAGPVEVPPLQSAGGEAASPEAGAGGSARIGGIAISHADRAVYSKPRVSKLQVAEHYAVFAPRILPLAGGRPVSLLRCPQGAEGSCFFQKHRSEGLPEAIGGIVVSETDLEPYVTVSSAAGLVAAAQMGTLEFHIWGVKNRDLERPDRLVFDLDPDEGLGFHTVHAAAVEFRDRLEALGLPSVPMLTGGKGVHVVAPLRPGAGWETVRLFSRTVAAMLAAAGPERYTATMAKAERRGRIFIDWMRNERGATAVAPYSLRARPGAPVAVPVNWEEFDGVTSAAAFDIASVRARLDAPCPMQAAVRRAVTLGPAVIARLERAL